MLAAARNVPQQIHTDNANQHTKPDDPGIPFVEEHRSDHRYKQHIHCRDKAGCPRRRVDDAHLLENAGRCQKSAAQDPSDDRISVVSPALVFCAAVFCKAVCSAVVFPDRPHRKISQSVQISTKLQLKHSVSLPILLRLFLNQIAIAIHAVHRILNLHYILLKLHECLLM